MHYFEINDNESTNKTWFSIHNPNSEMIGTSEKLESAQAVVNYLNGGNPPKPVVCIQGERVNLDEILGYHTIGKGWLCFKVHGAVNEGEEAHFSIKFETIEEAKNCAKWLDSLLNVVEYKPETLQNRE